MKKDDQEILVSASDIKVGDEVVVRMGKSFRLMVW